VEKMVNSFNASKWQMRFNSAFKGLKAYGQSLGFVQQSISKPLMSTKALSYGRYLLHYVFAYRINSSYCTA